MTRRTYLVASGGLAAVAVLVVTLALVLHGSGGGSGQATLRVEAASGPSTSPYTSPTSSSPSSSSTTGTTAGTTTPAGAADRRAGYPGLPPGVPPGFPPAGRYRTTTPATTPAGTTTTTQAAPTTSTTAPETTGTTTASTTTRRTTTAPPTTASTSSAPAPDPAPGGEAGSGRIRYGHTYTGRATFYGADGGGNCSYEPGGDLMVVAMNQTDYDNSAACGAYLRVTGPSGSATVKVVDRCPECPVGALDLSREAFAAIAPVSAGQVTVTWSLLSPALSGPISVRYKEGSSQYWCGVQIRNHRNPIRSVEAQVGGSWKTLPRQMYNYFLSESGAGCGGALRVTDIYGGVVTTGALPVRAGAVQSGPGQFPAP